ncbi:ArsR family transcriptional regulator [Candidatus Pacearchaeota archaeon]|nr:ArsR family transcriptional regulator [Candidatus Pacearchaeota archaeon]
MERIKTQIIRKDKKNFEDRCKYLKGDSVMNLFCSFTYITPNYDVIATLKELYNFAKDKNSKVFLIMWDMNTLANPYFKRYCLNNTKDWDSYINEKMLEVKNMTHAIGFNESNLIIYKSSELWKRLVSYEEENLFQQYFSILARLPVKDFIEFRKSSHIFQMALDLFFSNFFHKLYPEDVNREMDILFSDYYRKNLYLFTRKIMVEEGMIKNVPSILLMETVPYVVYQERVPEWEMNLEEIRDILINAPNKKEEYLKLLNYLEDGEITILGKDNLMETLAKSLFKYLQKHKKVYLTKNKLFEDSIINISNKQEAIKFGHILKSKISLNLLILANGTKNTSQIARELKKSVATISTYSAKLKKMGLLRTNSEGKLQRNLKGIKLNFELGL